MRKRFSFLGILLIIAVIGTPVYAVDEKYTILPEGGPEVVVDKVTLTYDANGGELVQEPAIVEKNTKVVISNVVPTRDGYKFLGWTINNSSLTYKGGDLLEVNESITLCAKWSANKYNITFNGNGSTSGKMTSLKNLVFNKNYVLTKNAYKKTGYAFIGWNTKADGTGESYNNNAEIQGLIGKNNATVTLYAQWKINEYDIVYNLNGGENNESNPVSYTIKTSTIKLASPKKTGYSFKGWYADSKYKTKITEIKKGSTGKKTLYAKWSATSYSITYELNGGKNSSKNPSSYKITTSTFALSNPSRTGYKFEGWYLDKEFTQKITGIEKGTTGKKTLYAKWSVNTYDIVYNLNGGENNGSNPASYTIKTSTIKLASPKKTGYSFKGWYTDSKYKTKITEIKKGSTGKKTLYAKWSATSYSITYELDGGKNSSKNPSSYKITTSTFALSNPSRTGYKFEGWYLDKEFTQKITGIEKGTTGKKTLYAKWSINTYDIVYNLNGGENNESNPVSYTIKTSTIKLASPKKTGYSFKGWYTDSKYKTKITEIKKGSTGKKTLYAKWEAIKYNVSFSANGGTGTVKTQSNLVYNKTYALNNNNFSKKGYKFVGWNTKADGTGDNYSNKASITNLTTTNNKTIKLYAQWEINEYTINYVLNGGTNNENNPVNYNVNTNTLKLYNPTRENYTFKGWYTDSNYKNKITEIKNGSTGNKKLYAKWKINAFIVYDTSIKIKMDTKVEIIYNDYNTIYCKTADSNVAKCSWEKVWDGNKTNLIIKPVNPGKTTITVYDNYEKVEIEVIVKGPWEDVVVDIPVTFGDEDYNMNRMKMVNYNFVSSSDLNYKIYYTMKLVNFDYSRSFWATTMYFYDKNGNIIDDSHISFWNVVIGGEYSDYSLVPMNTARIVIKEYPYTNPWEKTIVDIPETFGDKKYNMNRMKMLDYKFRAYDSSSYEMHYTMKLVELGNSETSWSTYIDCYDASGNIIKELSVSFSNITLNGEYTGNVKIPSNTAKIKIKENKYVESWLDVDVDIPATFGDKTYNMNRMKMLDYKFRAYDNASYEMHYTMKLVELESLRTSWSTYIDCYDANGNVISELSVSFNDVTLNGEYTGSVRIPSNTAKIKIKENKYVESWLDVDVDIPTTFGDKTYNMNRMKMLDYKFRAYDNASYEMHYTMKLVELESLRTSWSTYIDCYDANGNVISELPVSFSNVTLNGEYTGSVRIPSNTAKIKIKEYEFIEPWRDVVVEIPMTFGDKSRNMNRMSMVNYNFKTYSSSSYEMYYTLNMIQMGYSNSFWSTYIDCYDVNGNIIKELLLSVSNVTLNGEYTGSVKIPTNTAKIKIKEYKYVEPWKDVVVEIPSSIGATTENTNRMAVTGYNFIHSVSSDYKMYINYELIKHGIKSRTTWSQYIYFYDVNGNILRDTLVLIVDLVLNNKYIEEVSVPAGTAKIVFMDNPDDSSGEVINKWSYSDVLKLKNLFSLATEKAQEGNNTILKGDSSSSGIILIKLGIIDLMQAVLYLEDAKELAASKAALPITDDKTLEQLIYEAIAVYAKNDYYFDNLNYNTYNQLASGIVEDSVIGWTKCVSLLGVSSDLVSLFFN